MNISDFLNSVCKEIKYKPAKKEISEELNLHIQEIKEDYLKTGMGELEAEEKAVSQMGVAEEIGKELNKIHKPKLDFILLVLISIIIGFGIFISSLKQSFESINYVGNTFIYLFIGVCLSIGIYFL